MNEIFSTIAAVLTFIIASFFIVLSQNEKDENKKMIYMIISTLLILLLMYLVFLPIFFSFKKNITFSLKKDYKCNNKLIKYVHYAMLLSIILMIISIILSFGNLKSADKIAIELKQGIYDPASILLIISSFIFLVCFIISSHTECQITGFIANIARFF